MNQFFGISRTTLNGYLTPIMTICGVLTTYQMVTAPHWWTWVIAGAGLLSAVLHAIVGQGQGDAPPPIPPATK